MQPVLKQAPAATAEIPSPPPFGGASEGGESGRRDTPAASIPLLTMELDPFDFDPALGLDPLRPKPPRSHRATSAAACRDERAAASHWIEQGVDALLDGDYRAALQAYTQALQLNPHDPVAAANVDRLSQLLGHHREIQPGAR